MSTLTMPTLMVAFQQRANTAVARSQKGTVAFVIRDAAANSADQTYALASTGQIPKTLGTANQDAVRRVFQGRRRPGWPCPGTPSAGCFRAAPRRCCCM